jgi:hypothetical protein
MSRAPCHGDISLEEPACSPRCSRQARQSQGRPADHPAGLYLAGRIGDLRKAACTGTGGVRTPRQGPRPATGEAMCVALVFPVGIQGALYLSREAVRGLLEPLR